MFLPIPIFIPVFPYVKFRKRYSPNEYLRVKHRDASKDEKYAALVKRNRELLSSNGVPLNKIRFVPQPCFQYDIDKDVINPSYELFVPLRKDGTGLFDKDAPTITIGMPPKMITVMVRNYRVDDNYEYLKHILESTKKGIVVFVVDEMHDDLLTGKPLHYYSGVDAEQLRFAVLDEEIQKYEHPETQEV
jgi:hypothetical protein